MAERMRTRSCSIAELFSDRYRFRLPYFQRGYAWQVAHVERLLDDILEVAEGRRKLPWYPLGSIIIAKEEDVRDAWLTDGQQRLLTLTILIASLRDTEGDETLRTRLSDCVFRVTPTGGKDPRLHPHSLDSRCFSDFVQVEGGTLVAHDGDVEDLGESESNIVANRDWLRERLSTMTPESRRRLSHFLLDECIIAVMEVDSDEIARVLFSTMHDTGLKPTSSDLFKAEILGTIHAEQREAARASWEGLEVAVGKANIDLLLRQIAVLADRASPKEAVEVRLDEIFELGQPDKAFAFVEGRLCPLGHQLATVLSAQLAANDKPTPLQRYLRFLSWVRNHDTWLSPTLHWLDTNGMDHDDTVEFLRRLEALAWTQMILAGDPAVRDRRYMDLLMDISSGRALSEESALRITDGERSEVRKILAGPNFTKRRYKLFLLLRVDAELRGDAEPLTPPVGTVEHIFPGRPQDGSRWKVDFKGQQAGVLRQTLGNLTLLTIEEQNIVKNMDFAHKRPVYATSGFKVTRVLADHQAWTPRDVTARTEALVDIAMRAWGIN